MYVFAAAYVDLSVEEDLSVGALEMAENNA